jgi:hypothetical protein
METVSVPATGVVAAWAGHAAASTVALAAPAAQ